MPSPPNLKPQRLHVILSVRLHTTSPLDSRRLRAFSTPFMSLYGRRPIRKFLPRSPRTRLHRLPHPYLSTFGRPSSSPTLVHLAQNSRREENFADVELCNLVPGREKTHGHHTHCEVRRSDLHCSIAVTAIREHAGVDGVIRVDQPLDPATCCVPRLESQSANCIGCSGFLRSAWGLQEGVGPLDVV